MKVGLVSLGCDKNRVDAEKMLKRLENAGYEITENAEEADVLVINTCAFIDAAKKEAIDNILAGAELKKRKDVKLIVTGCFSTRYPEECKEGFPEVDAFLSVKEEEKIAEIADELTGAKKEKYGYDGGRVSITPPWIAYLKISDGCNNRCTYCAIPSIRGKYRSVPMEELISEAKDLAINGVKELIVVAQDTTEYGVDIYGERKLKELLENLCKLDFWKVRLLYAYPDRIDDELLAFLDNEDKMAKYLDIPIQHIDDDILKKMNRKATGEQIKTLIGKIRSAKNYIAIRSSFIVGFPTETEEAFEKLKTFARENIDYPGFFAYSKEEGTPAALMKGQISSSVKNKRKKEAEKAGQSGVIEKQERLVGKTAEVICDGIDMEKGYFFGRTEYQTPDVDTFVYFTADFNVVQGEVYKVKITENGFRPKGIALKEENAL